MNEDQSTQKQKFVNQQSTDQETSTIKINSLNEKTLTREHSKLLLTLTSQSKEQESKEKELKNIIKQLELILREKDSQINWMQQKLWQEDQRKNDFSGQMQDFFSKKSQYRT